MSVLDGTTRVPVPSERERAAGAEPDLDDLLVAGGPQLLPTAVAAGLDDEDGDGLDQVAPRRGLRALSPRAVTGGRSATPLVALALLGLFSGWDDATFRLLLPEIQRELGIDLAAVGALTAVAALAGALAAPALGLLADRVRRIRMIQVGSIIANLTSVAIGFAPARAGVIGLTRATGTIAGTAAQPAQLPLLADWYPKRSRARVFGYVSVAVAVGGVVGPLVGGLVNVAVGWRFAVGGLGVLATLVSLVSLRLREPTPDLADPAAAAAVAAPALGWAEAWRATRRIRTVRRLWYAAPFLVAAGTAAGTLTTFYYAEVYGLGSAGRGVIEAILALSAVVGLFFGAPVADRLVATRPTVVLTAMAALFAFEAIAITGLVVAPVLWVAVLVNVPLALGFGLVGVAADVLTSLVLPKRLRAFGMQTLTLFGIPGLALVPILSGLADDYGLRKGLLFVIPVYLVGAVVVGSAGKDLAADLRDAETAAAVVLVGVEDALVVVQDLEVTFGGATVLAGVDVVVREGEIVALVGTNGAGKSTLLRAIAGLAPATGGAVAFDGVDVTARPPHELAAEA